MIRASQQQKEHLLSSVLPNSICKILSNSVIIINLWWSKNDYSLYTVGMGMATIFSVAFGYLLISSLNIGLTYQISRKRNNPTLIGIFYQRTLLVNFLFCVFVITPVLYLSKNIVHIFSKIEYTRKGYAFTQTANTIGDYLYQLVPSIYAFAFYDTTQSFLLAQRHILAPLVIQIIAIITHLLLIKHIGPAWSKNTIDILSSIAIYVYIITLKTPLKAWIEWNIKCIKGWKNYLKFLEIICFTTYLQGLFFFFFSVLGYNLQVAQLSCHIIYINIYQFLFLLYIGMKQGALTKIGHHIKKNQYHQYRKEGIRSIKLFVVISLLFIIFIYVFQQEFCDFLFQYASYSEVFSSNLYLLAITVIIDSFQLGITSLMKALNKNQSVLKFNIFFYSIALFICYYLCYNKGMGMKGLWIGWIIGLTLNSLFSLILLLRKKKAMNKKKLNKPQKQLNEIKQQQSDSNNENSLQFEEV